jgi:hypothetical protein
LHGLDRILPAIRLPEIQSMIPKGGYRFSEKIMLKRENLDPDPIQLNWISV